MDGLKIGEVAKFPIEINIFPNIGDPLGDLVFHRIETPSLERDSTAFSDIECAFSEKGFDVDLDSGFLWIIKVVETVEGDDIETVKAVLSQIGHVPDLLEPYPFSKCNENQKRYIAGRLLNKALIRRCTSVGYSIIEKERARTLRWYDSSQKIATRGDMHLYRGYEAKFIQFMREDTLDVALNVDFHSTARWVKTQKDSYPPFDKIASAFSAEMKPNSQERRQYILEAIQSLAQNSLGIRLFFGNLQLLFGGAMAALAEEVRLE